MASPPATHGPRLQMRGVVKRFGATLALDGVDLTVAPGEVHALIGENGAGKSTLMKVLSGAVRPDAGAMHLDGQPFAPAGPLAARAAGVAMIYQELTLAPHLTVEQNLTLGVEHHRLGFIQRAAYRDRVADALACLNHPELRPGAPVRRLSPASRQLVEIARALLLDARILVMDEPTSSLGLADIEHLFLVIDALRQSGVSVVYISHFLEEVQRVADRYTVLRDGRTVGTGRLADATQDQLVELMIGRKLDEMFPQVPHAPGPPVLELKELLGARMTAGASLTVHRGEILGLAGLVGAGRTELARTIFGMDFVRSGTVRVAGISRSKHSPANRLSEGVGLLSEDRQSEGLAVGRTVAENVTLSRPAPFTRWGFVSLRGMHRATSRWIDALGIRVRGSNQAVRELSGGNQQKVALARLLHHDVDVLILDEPTRGIDVASKAQIYRLIGELAARGKAVLVISSYVPELLGICDRIAVMHRGRLVPPRPAGEWTEHAIIAAAAGGRESSA